MAKTGQPAPEESPIEEIDATSSGAPTITAGTDQDSIMEAAPNPASGSIDIDSILSNEGSGDFLTMLDKSAAGLNDARLFAPDTHDAAVEAGNAYEGLLARTDRDTPNDTKADADDIMGADDPELAEMAKALGMTVEELLGTPATPKPDQAQATQPDSVRSAALLADKATEPAPAAPSPEILALQQELAATRQMVESFQKQQQESQQQAMSDAAAIAAIAQERANYEQQQREVYEDNYDHLDEVDRQELVDKLVAADLVVFDSQQTEVMAAQRQEAIQKQEQLQQREQGYANATKQLVEANPTMGVTLMEDYNLANFLADTHRAAVDAYGDVGPFEPYAKAFESSLKQIQTNAFRAGLAAGQKRASKTSDTPPVLSNQGGGGAPAAPKGGTPTKSINLDQFNFFASDDGAQRRR